MSALTLFVLLGVCVMLQVVKKLGGQSAKYFLRSSRSRSAAVNGYIEEMINGQKVIKVFCHEEKCKEQFDELNDELCENAASANTYANILMPIMMNIGNLLYVLVAVVGGRAGAVRRGRKRHHPRRHRVLPAADQERSTSPITQISQQFNSIVMALAGAERIFDLMDEQPEAGRRLCDPGQRQVRRGRRARGNAGSAPASGPGSIPHEDGTITYTQS